MRTRVVALAAAALLLVLAAPSHAQQQVQFAAVARSTGTQLTLQGQGLFIGTTGTLIGTAPVDLGNSPIAGCPAESTGCASSTPSPDTTIVATREDPGPKTTEAGTTSGTDLSQVVDATFGAGRVSFGPGELAQASAQGLQADVTLTQSVIEGVPGLNDAVDQVREGVGGVLDQIGQEDPSGTVNQVNRSLQGLLEDLTSGPLATIDGNPASSAVADNGTVTSAESAVGGFRVVLIPGAEAAGNAPGFATFEVGTATARASSDRTTGTASFEVSGLTFRILNPLTGEFEEERFESGEGRMCFSDEAPPELAAVVDLCVTLAGGDTTMQGPAAAARASGASIEMFVMQEPLLQINLADAVAGVNSQIVTPPAPTPTPTPTPVRILPATGAPIGPIALALLGGGGLLSAATLRGRRRQR